MSSGLPLEVLGLMGPLLCWVEGIQRPGVPESWYAQNFSFEERLQGWLMRELPTYSYDNLQEIIKLAGDLRMPSNYPGEPLRSKYRKNTMAPPPGFDLVYIFHRLSRRYFQWAGNELCIRDGRMVELHELAMRFPVRHLIQYCHADAVARGYMSFEHVFELPVHMSQLHTTYQGLRTVVEHGLSEGHLHLNGIVSADECWTDHLLRRLAPGARDGFTPEANRLLVLSRTAVRLLAIGVLYSFIDANINQLPFHLIAQLDNLYRATTPMESRYISRQLNNEFLREIKILQNKLLESPAEIWEKELKWLMPLLNSDINCIIHKGFQYQLTEGGVVKLKGLRRRMRLLKRLHLNVQRILVERNIHTRLFPPKYDSSGSKISGIGIFKKQETNPVREFMHQLACRYLIYHAHHWQKATQSGKTTGLRNFQQFFDAVQRDSLAKDSIEIQGLAIEQLSRAEPLRAVEGRLSPPSTGTSRFIPWILAFAHQVKSDQLDKFGIVVHFRKDSFEKIRNRTPDNGTLKLRYGKIRRLTQAKAFKLFRLLSTSNPVVPFIVGIDAASLELTTPPEVFGPVFRFLRDFPIKLRRSGSTKEILSNYKNIAALVENRRLGMTYHVGEDFRHLLSGLRAIHEVIEFLKPLPGDRLGHAIALALDPGAWAAQVGYQAVMPMQEWLDTLVWLHYLLGPGHDLIGQLAVEDQIQLYSRKIYGKTVLDRYEKGQLEREWMPTTLYDSWRLRQLDPYSVARSHLVDNKFRIRQRGNSNENKRWADVQENVLNEVDQHVGTEAAFHLVKLYWYCPRVYEIGSEIITIDMQDKKNLWLEIFKEAQQKVQALVRDRQLVVEVNPSSNRNIGPMEKMADHPIFQLTLDKQQQLARQIRVTINTDDPGVFATSLTHEFYLLGEILLNRGIPEAEVVEWLEWLRKNGKEYSFLRVLPHADDEHMESILKSLFDKYTPILRRLRGERRHYYTQKSRIKLNTELEHENRILKTRYKQLETRLEMLEKKLPEGLRKQD